MMLPATANSPPNSFRPSRWLFESRPLREEPPAFLCAMASIPSVRSYVAHFCDEIITFFGDWRELSWAPLNANLGLCSPYGCGSRHRNPLAQPRGIIPRLLRLGRLGGHLGLALALRSRRLRGLGAAGEDLGDLHQSVFLAMPA